MTTFMKRKGGAVLLQMTNLPVNGLSHKVRTSLMKDLEQAVKDKATAVVLMGAGNHFSAGADIAEFARGGHRTSPSLTDVIDYMDAYNTPLVAGIHGTALGGGLETALACHWRVGNGTALVGLPEVKLGILPGAGGTQRLPRLTGIATAIDIMTTGRMIASKEALSLGIIDKLLDTTGDVYIDAVVEFALSEQVQTIPVAQRRVSKLAVPGNINEETFRSLYEDVKKNAKGAVAPLAIFKAVQAAAVFQSFPEGLKKEKDLFEELVKGPQSKALQYFFFSERRVSTLPEGALKDQPTGAVTTTDINQAGVVGGGTMGQGIVMNLLNTGIPVTLLEINQSKADAAKTAIEKTYKSSSAYKTGKMTDIKLSQLLEKLTPTERYSDLHTMDLVIEAGFENMKVKQEIFTKLDQVCKKEAILASNTSYLDIEEIAQATRRPHHVIGMHFFSPAHIMPLLEIVRGSNTATETIATCMSLGKRMKKVSVLSGNCYGFIGNRMLDPYIREAQFLVEEGASPYQVDRVMKDVLGFAMGPFEMFDLAGIDIGVQVRKSRTESMIAVYEQQRQQQLNQATLDNADPSLAQSNSSVKSPRVIIDPKASMSIPSMLYSSDEERLKDEEAAKEAQTLPPPLDRPLELADWYSSLSEIMCDRGYLGQKTKHGFYAYSNCSQPRRGYQSEEVLSLIASHRTTRGITPRIISDEEILERCVYPLVNEGFRVLEEGIALRPEDVDMVYVYGYGFPKYRGGPLFYAEHEVSLLKIYRALVKHHKACMQRPWLKPCALLESVVESGASLREEMYFRKQNHNNPTTPPAITR